MEARRTLRAIRHRGDVDAKTLRDLVELATGDKRLAEDVFTDHIMEELRAKREPVL
jgi:ribosomal protein L19E